VKLPALLRRLFSGSGTRSVADEQWHEVERELPFLDLLDNGERLQLRALALEFLRSKQFYGAHGFALSDPVLLSIALQACLPVLKLGLSAYRGWVGVVVYPGEFVVPREVADEAGVVHAFDDEVLGEAWEGGPVLLSWSTPDEGDGINVVIHEFAHKLDMLDGEVDGIPPLPADISRATWTAVLDEAADTLCERLDAGEASCLDGYACESPAEFFAVASETFFQHPRALHAEFPALYRILARFYRLDLAARKSPSERSA
jgi:Mlc titration factor MtfA (ptsG expression regulator)